MISISIGIIVAYSLGENCGLKDHKTGNQIGGLYGTAIATMGMFSNGVFV